METPNSVTKGSEASAKHSFSLIGGIELDEKPRKMLGTSTSSGISKMMQVADCEFYKETTMNRNPEVGS